MKPAFLMPPIEADPYFWMFEVGSNKLGVHQHVGWCMKLGERIVLLDSEEKCVLLEPILEVEEERLFTFLGDIKKEYPAYAWTIDRFPKVMLLKHVFHTSCSGYWPEKALTWLKTDSSIQNLFHDELERFIENKVMPQDARQRARKILQGLPSDTLGTAPLPLN